MQFDNQYAIDEGWCISETNTEDPFRLEKIDEEEVFEFDQQAWEFVYRMALLGSRYHQSALQFLEEYSPEEFERIEDHNLLLGDN